MSQVSAEFIPTRIAILTVSNRRGEEDDTSGHYLRDSAQEAGHQIVDKAIVKDWLNRRGPGAGSAATAVRQRSRRVWRSIPYAVV